MMITMHSGVESDLGLNNFQEVHNKTHETDKITDIHRDFIIYRIGYTNYSKIC